jgi:hypothetical protein
MAGYAVIAYELSGVGYVAGLRKNNKIASADYDTGL